MEMMLEKKQIRVIFFFFNYFILIGANYLTQEDTLEKEMATHSSTLA